MAYGGRILPNRGFDPAENMDVAQELAPEWEERHSRAHSDRAAKSARSGQGESVGENTGENRRFSPKTEE